MYNNQDNLKTPATFIKTITIIHLALLIGQVLFCLTAFFVTNSTVINLKPGDDVFFYVAPALVVFGILFGSFLFKQQLVKLADKTLLGEKSAGYQSALIRRYALNEGPSMFGIVVYMLTGNLFYLILTGFNVLYFIWIRPTKEKIENDIDLSYEEKLVSGW